MIGQTHIQQQIKSEIQTGSLARFIILVGDAGSGRKTLAKEVATWLNSQFILVDKGVEAIRNIIEQSYKLSEDVLYVIDGDSLSPAAKSSLLKVTEEPPNRARFILTITDAERTLSTLVSRARVMRMDNYTAADIAAFAGKDDSVFAEYCTNKYEVDLLNTYGCNEFKAFVELVLDNIAYVSGANALKIETKLAFKGESDKYDVKLFLQAFRTECLSKLQASETPDERVTYINWISTTTEILHDLKLPSINKANLIDKWIFKLRKESRLS